MPFGFLNKLASIELVFLFKYELAGGSVKQRTYFYDSFFKEPNLSFHVKSIWIYLLLYLNRLN